MHILYGVQSKLTMWMDAARIHKAKCIAKIKGTSVSLLFGEFIIAQENDDSYLNYPDVTLSMLGVMKQKASKIQDSDYLRHLTIPVKEPFELL